MTQDIVTLYVTLFSQFFTLSSSTNSPANLSTSFSAGDANSLLPLPPFVPPASNAMTISHWLQKTLTELSDCVSELGPLDLASEANQSFKELVASTRWRFEEAVCAAWVRGLSFSLYMSGSRY